MPLPPDRVAAASEPIRFPIAPPAVGAVHPAHAPLWQTAACKQAVVAVWLLGSAVALLRLLAGLIAMRRVTSRETESDPVLSQMVTRLQHESGMAQTVAVRKTIAGSALPVPLTWSLFRPTLLLPPTFLEWPQERRRMVLLHELAHIQRADWLVQILVQITRALYWFHPLVWWITHRLQAESERACDDTVLLTGVVPSACAETLLEVLRTMNRPQKSVSSPASLLSMARPPIEARLQAILSPQRRQKPSRSIAMLASAGAAVCAIALASVQVQAGQASTSPGRTPGIPATSAAPSPAGIPPQRRMTPGLLLTSAQTGAGKHASKPPKSQDANEVAVLRKKLDVLEQILVQNQQENTKLRLQLRAMETRNRRAADVNSSLGGVPPRSSLLYARTGDAARGANASKKMPPVSPAVRLETLQNVLRDLERQQTTLQAQVKQTAELYRAGSITFQTSTEEKTELDVCKLHIEAVQKQIDDVKAGRTLSEKEQNLRLLRLQIAESQVRLLRQQEILAVTKTRYQAGVTSGGELTNVEAKRNAIQTYLDELKAKLAEEGAH